MDSLWFHVAALATLWALLNGTAPDKAPRLRFVAVACLEAYVLRYYIWRATETLPSFDCSLATAWQWLFFVFESLATLFLCWTALILTRTRDNRSLADTREGELRGKPVVPKVTVLIPTYHEPLEVLQGTIRAAMRIDYPNFEVIVLDDDKGRVHTDLPDLCSRFGARYLHRADSEGAKAGNLNYGLSRSDGEVLLVLDADFHPKPEILWRTVGLLDDKTALVQTPQHYYSPDPIQHNLGGGRAWTEEQRFFFDVAIPAREAWGNAICVGTSFVVSRAALGPRGFEVDCLSEDVYGGYALVSRGWRVRYLNECLSYGAAADSVVEYIRQRVRWCQGIIQAVGLPYGPLHAPNLSLIDRLLYLEMPLYWISQYGLLALMVVAPAVYFWTGVPVFESTFDEAEAHVVPRIMASALVTYWLSGGKVMPIVTDVAKLVSTPAIIKAMLTLLWNPKGKPFEATNKGQSRSSVIVHWSIMWPFLLAAGLTAAGLVRNLLSDGPVMWNEFLAANVLLACYSLALLFLACVACVDRPKAALAFDYGQPLQGRWLRALAVLFGPWRP